MKNSILITILIITTFLLLSVYVPQKPISQTDVFPRVEINETSY
jgi:hypothetical protein